eukprot:TRINITY_DN4577_c0_g1_i1.p1 TRINITY_DN4577_c0_g1~~TRINITY_DN4577_c0_g1_i1.p1  ORF type:complete len:754 (+),score=149.08 TRINITY_DN4577_c0_g1_i1:181-2442(+)
MHQSSLQDLFKTWENNAEVPKELLEYPSVISMYYTQRLWACWNRSDQIFKLLNDDGYYQQPIDLRHPFIFYLGHLPAFTYNQIAAILKMGPCNKQFDQLFERGIDPDVETGKVHSHSCDRNRTEWPTVHEVEVYRDQVRKKVLDTVFVIVSQSLKAENDPMYKHCCVLEAVLEHEYMHQETLQYMLICLKPTFFDKKYLGTLPHVVTAPCDGSIENKFLKIGKGKTTLGVKLGSIPFGWDNEFTTNPQAIDVPEFDVTKYPITNGEFLKFLEAGGYDNQSLWTESGWTWKLRDKITHPQHWRLDPESKTWFVRTLGGIEYPMNQTLTWPVYVSQVEAMAYCKWVGGRLPSEAEWMRAAYTAPNRDEMTPYPWGDASPSDEHGNIDFSNWAPTPVNLFPKGDSSWGLSDLIGNGYEWTNTVFDGFAGFQAYLKSYPNYSQDFFDGKHFVLKGGSWATSKPLIRKSFRNWFQAHYPYIFAKFRCVKSESEGNEVMNKRKNSNSDLVSISEIIYLDTLRPEEKIHKSHEAFALDILNGLSKPEKRIPSVWFYDDKGSEIYTKITQLVEYYPYACELEILNTSKSVIASLIDTPKFNVVELGAGDGTKTKVLLEHFAEKKMDFVYSPIDISDGALLYLSKVMKENFSKLNYELKMQAVCSDNMKGLKYLCSQSGSSRNLVLFLGSSIGNTDFSGNLLFLQELWHRMNDGDIAIIGFDLKKNPHILNLAYDDPHKVTQDFNYNLLERINRYYYDERRW